MATQVEATSPTAASNRLTGDMVQAMRQDLRVTVAELAQACGIQGPSIEAIERGRATTPAERNDIAAGFAWLLNNHLNAV